MRTKGSTSKGRVTTAREGSTHTYMGKGSGRGAGVNTRDPAVEKTSSGAGSTLKYRSGDVKRSTGSMKKYG